VDVFPTYVQLFILKSLVNTIPVTNKVIIKIKKFVRSDIIWVVFKYFLRLLGTMICMSDYGELRKRAQNVNVRKGDVDSFIFIPKWQIHTL